MWRKRTEMAGMMLLACAPVLRSDEPAQKPAEVKPQWQRLLQGEDATRAGGLEEEIARLQAAGKFEEALKDAQTLAELRKKVQGEDHWEAVNVGWRVTQLRQFLKQDAATRAECARLGSLLHEAVALQEKARYQEAQALCEKCLAICRRVLGDEDPATAGSYDARGVILMWQAKYREADDDLRMALAIRRKVLGERHPDTAGSYHNVASNTSMQGKFAAAEEGLNKALAIRRAVLGEEDPATAQSYDRLAGNLLNRGKYSEAEASYGKALAIDRKVLGEEHGQTAAIYKGLADSLNSQGKYAEAEDHYRKALAINRKVLGEEHEATARSYLGIAKNMDAQGRYVEAEDYQRKALDLNRKLLGENAPYTVLSYNNLASSLHAQGKYAQADEGFRKALAYFRKAFGEDNPATATAYNNLASNLKAQGKYAEADDNFRKALASRRKVLGDEHPDTAAAYSNLAGNLEMQDRPADAETQYRTALAICRKVLGDEHPRTALVRANLGGALKTQGKYSEAVIELRDALAVRRRKLGEAHPLTAHSYGLLASVLDDQGKQVEAEELHRKALAITRGALGEEHPQTGAAYNNLGINLGAHGKYMEADNCFRRALLIRRKVSGEEHPDTASCYNNLAANLLRQGRYAEAEKESGKALAIYCKVQGEERSSTAVSYHNLGHSLQSQARYAEAASAFGRALAIHRKVLGEEHPLTALGCHNLAVNLSMQGRYVEAEEGFRKVLAIRRRVLGEDHPDTAASYSNLAADLDRQGRFAEAEAGHRKALTSRTTVLGEDHILTVRAYSKLGVNLYCQGKYAEAEEALQKAADRFGRARAFVAEAGLERGGRNNEENSSPWLVAVLARRGKLDAAWQRFEESLGRGTWDDLSARLRRPPAERARQAELAAALMRLDQLIDKAVAVKEPTPEQKRQRDELFAQRLEAENDRTAFARRLEETYGPIGGAVFERGRVQAALPADAALVAWLDVAGHVDAAGHAQAHDPNGDHWAILLRSAGEPVFVRLHGSGPQHAWTAADTNLPGELRTALQSDRGNWRPLAQRLRQQRLDPLARHLAAVDGRSAVRHLIVLPSRSLAGLPVEVFAEDYTVSYANSGTLHAHVRQQPRPDSRGLLAVGDPVFDLPAARSAPRPLRQGGALITMVTPRSNAAAAQPEPLRPNDVLLRYNGADLASPADLKPLPEAADPDKRVTVTVWREKRTEGTDGWEGKTFQAQLRPGNLGVVLANEPAPKALAEQHRLDQRPATAGDEVPDLPGTRIEVEALRRLFGGDPAPRLLLDSQASEQKLYELAASGELGKYRYVHLATHGDIDNTCPMNSAVLLARDALPDPAEQLLKGLPVQNGRLTMRTILETWNLHSELVTLSACRTGLGKYENGEGYVGFAQALVLSGSRSVCLSLWKVDDAATALLMVRFYRNLLGKRDGLKAPMPKAAALQEAKEWLRQLPRDEALRLAAAASNGVERDTGRKLKKSPVSPVPPGQSAKKDDCPYAHPYYWAAFMLIGDPE